MIIRFLQKHEIARFMVVGGCAVLAHYLTYWCLISICLPYNVSYAAGFMVGVILNFLGSNYFTFKTRPTLSRAIKFALGHVVNFLVQMLLLNICIYVNVAPKLAPLIVFTLAFPVNFLLIRFLLKGKTRKEIVDQQNNDNGVEI